MTARISEVKTSQKSRIQGDPQKRKSPEAQEEKKILQHNLPEGNSAVAAENTGVRGSAALPVGVCAAMKFGMVGEGKDGIADPLPGTGAPDPIATAEKYV